MKDFPNQKFSLSCWLEDEKDTIYCLNDRVEKRPDCYRPGPITFGKDPKRGRAIQSGRLKKQKKTNIDFFLKSILPKIENELDPLSWKDIAYNFDGDMCNQFMLKGGFELWKKEDRQSWIHPSFQSDYISKAIEIGAEKVEFGN